MDILEMLRKKTKGLPIRAALYARYSSDSQSDGNSIEAQVMAIKDYAQRENICIVKEYIDKAQSGTSANRPEFLNMLEDAKQKTFSIVLVHKYDRFMRNECEAVYCEQKLSRYDVFLISASEPINSDEPTSDLTRAIIRSFAAYYSKNLSREVMKGMIINAKNGYSNGGSPPLGYTLETVNVSEGKTRKCLTINEDEAKIVKLIFYMVIDGAGYTEIMNKLNDMGYRTKSGNRFGKNSIHDILRNRKYKGDFIFNKCTGKDKFSHTRNSHKFKPEEEWIVIKNGIPAIIPEEDFEKVQEILDGRRQIKHPEYMRTYLLSGKIYCGNCSHAYTGNYDGAHKDREPYITYRCSSRYSKGRAGGCKNKPVRCDDIEAFVLTKIADNVFNPQIVDKVMSKLEEYFKNKNSKNAEEIKIMKKSLTKYSKQEENILNAISETDSDIVRKNLMSQLEKISTNKEQTEKALSELQGLEKAIVPKRPLLKQLFKTAKQQFINGTLKETKDIINIFVNKITVGQDIIELNINLIPLIAFKPGLQDSVTITRKDLKGFSNKAS